MTKAVKLLNRNNVQETIEHYGIKGMKWGVRRDPQQLRKARGVRPWENVSDEVRSRVREHRMAKGSRAVSKMSDSELRSHTERLRNENNLKRLSKADKFNKVKRQEYRKRHTMTDDELKKKVDRYQLEENLMQQSRTATKDTRILANKAINEVSKMALNKFTDDKGKNFSATGDPIADTLLSSILNQTKERNVIKQSGIGDEEGDNELDDNELIEHILASTPSDLEHYGIKGMKWGVRRFQPYSKGKRAKAKGGKPGKEIGKAKSKRQIRKENREAIRKKNNPKGVSTRQLKKERVRIAKEEHANAIQDIEKSINKELMDLAKFAKDNGLDQDDGGGGNNPKASREYANRLADIESRVYDMERIVNKRTSKRLISEFGDTAVKRINDSTKRKQAAILAAPLAMAVGSTALSLLVQSYPVKDTLEHYSDYIF